MLVSHVKKFIYLKTTKTAGTSTETYFEKYCRNPETYNGSEISRDHVSEYGMVGLRDNRIYNNPKYQLSPNTLTAHMNAVNVKLIVGNDKWDSYFKFCNIRNPFDRMISAYFFTIKNNIISKNNVQNDFENWLLRSQDGFNDIRYYTIEGNYCCDDYIRYENLYTDMERICNILDIEWNPNIFPKFKSEYRPEWATFKYMYTNESRKMVEDKHKFELDLFNYDFPNIL